MLQYFNSTLLYLIVKKVEFNLISLLTTRKSKKMNILKPLLIEVMKLICKKQTSSTHLRRVKLLQPHLQVQVKEG
ncbi:hypothetical protein SK128_000607, partial [Halocaridina rubra]